MADLLETIGLGRDRVRMVNLSSAMAIKFADTVKEMTEQVQALGPNPLHST